MNVVEKNVYQSRWGFHPCDKETFQMLKFLHKHWHITVRQSADWERWNRKEPQNRVIREWIRDDQGHKVGSRVIGPRPEPQVCPHFTHDVCRDYQNARMPCAEQDVKPLVLSEAKIVDLYHKVKEWFGQ